MSGSLLIVSCGNTDLQVVATVDGQKVRLNFPTARAAHDALLAQDNRYRIDEDAATWNRDKNLTAGYNAKDDKFFVEKKGSPDEPLSFPISLLPARLAGIGAAVAGKPRPAAVIVFNTRRDDRADEPVAAGPILSKWLAEVFNLKWAGMPGLLGRGISGWLDYLTGTMRSEGADGENVNRDAVARIDEALRSLGAFEAVYFAPAGGITAMREQIRAAARFRFAGAKFFDFPNAERPGKTLIERSTPATLPSDSFRARQQARDLVKRGSFTGAAVIADRFATQKNERAWGSPTRPRGALF